MGRHRGAAPFAVIYFRCVGLLKNNYAHSGSGNASKAPQQSNENKFSGLDPESVFWDDVLYAAVLEIPTCC